MFLPRNEFGDVFLTLTLSQGGQGGYRRVAARATAGSATDCRLLLEIDLANM